MIGMENVAALWDQGFKDSEIAKRLGIAEQDVYQLVKAYRADCVQSWIIAGRPNIERPKRSKLFDGLSSRAWGVLVRAGLDKARTKGDISQIWFDVAQPQAIRFCGSKTAKEIMEWLATA